MIKTNLNDMAVVIASELQQYANGVSEEVKAVTRDVAKQCLREIKDRSPRLTGKYRSGWTETVTEENSARISIEIHNQTKPWLAHLLEFGHAKRGGGRVNGTPHIRPAAEKAEQNLIDKIKVIV